MPCGRVRVATINLNALHARLDDADPAEREDILTQVDTQLDKLNDASACPCIHCRETPAPAPDPA